MAALFAWRMTQTTATTWRLNVSPETEKARRQLVDEIVESEPRLKRARESQENNLQYLMRKRAELVSAIAAGNGEGV
jgi:hypothetical protein